MQTRLSGTECQGDACPGRQGQERLGRSSVRVRVWVGVARRVVVDVGVGSRQQEGLTEREMRQSLAYRRKRSVLTEVWTAHGKGQWDGQKPGQSPVRYLKQNVCIYSGMNGDPLDKGMKTGYCQI